MIIANKTKRLANIQDQLKTLYDDEATTDEVSTSAITQSQYSSPTPLAKEEEDPVTIASPMLEKDSTSVALVLTPAHSPQSTTPLTTTPMQTTPAIFSDEDNDEYQPYSGNANYVEIDSSDETMKHLTPQDPESCELKLL
jgi:hypothetical protein